MDKPTIAQVDISALIKQTKRNHDSVKAIIMVELPVDTILAMDAVIDSVDVFTRDNFVDCCINVWLQNVETSFGETS